MNNFDMPTQLDVINFHNTHDTLCVPKGMTLKQLVEDYDRLNNIINELEQFINNQNYWVCELGYKEFTPYIPAKKIIDKLKELKENK